MIIQKNVISCCVVCTAALDQTKLCVHEIHSAYQKTHIHTERRIEK